jgi:hypothetical protein
MFSTGMEYRILLGNAETDPWADWVSFSPQWDDPGEVVWLYCGGGIQVLEKHFLQYGRAWAEGGIALVQASREPKLLSSSNRLSLLDRSVDVEHQFTSEGFFDEEGVFWEPDHSIDTYVSDDGRKFPLYQRGQLSKQGKVFHKKLAEQIASEARKLAENSWLSALAEDPWLSEEDDYNDEFPLLEEGGEFQAAGFGMRGEILARILNFRRLETMNSVSSFEFGSPTRVPHSSLALTSEPLSEEALESVNLSLRYLTDSRYEFVQRFGEVGTRVLLIQGVKDNFTSVEVGFENVGDGLSQLLPLIVQMAAEGGVVLRQPELHLHPKMQSDFASILFLNSMLRPVIVETHSENILLRLQKKIRLGIMPREQLRIIYCEPEDGKRNRAVNITLDSAGDVLDPMPISFSDLRLQDLL